MGTLIDALATFMKDSPDLAFHEQVKRYAYGEMKSGDQFVVARSSHDAGLLEAPDLPVLMKQSTLKKVQIDHEIPLSEIVKLPTWLKEHPLAMESITEENALIVVADARDVNGNDIVIAVHLEKEPQGVTINEISSIYGKRNLAYLVENTLSLGREVYTNERTGDWILRTGVPFPEQIANRLCASDCNRRQARFQETQRPETPRHSDTPADDARAFRAQAASIERQSARGRGKAR